MRVTSMLEQKKFKKKKETRNYSGHTRHISATMDQFKLSSTCPKKMTQKQAVVFHSEMKRPARRKGVLNSRPAPHTSGSARGYDRRSF